MGVLCPPACHGAQEMVGRRVLSWGNLSPELLPQLFTVWGVMAESLDINEALDELKEKELNECKFYLQELFNIPQASLEGVTTSHELTELLVKRFPGKAKEVLYSPLDKCGCKDLAMQLMEQGAGIHRLCLVPPVLSLGTPEKSLAPLSLLPPFGYSYTSRRSPLSLLFCSLNNPSSLSLSSYDVLKNSGLKLSRINHLA
ncbi:uncharacterized protein LOC112973088 isoform X4 [Apteryx rowi]|uniref:uncharacterized protein LOC112973088 isoform X4 n=1 Tax=Apteryx rowi TaxID=308060 RepID=UPI000E1DFDF5|nr:uncharacterized protein LOC112973088 isoform X4 [Apteryx rowi]